VIGEEAAILACTGRAESRLGMLCRQSLPPKEVIASSHHLFMCEYEPSAHPSNFGLAGNI
jgi:hypothetical protein